MDEIEQYSILKAEVINLVGCNFSLEQIKECFAPYINSNRALSRAKSLTHIIHLLQERDVLNSKRVSCLYYLGEQLSNENIKRVVHVYRKLYLEGSDDTCICGLTFTHQQETAPLSELNQNHHPTSSNTRPNDDVLEKIRNISLGIGENWPILAMYLKVGQREIDYILSRYPDDTVEQSYQALCIWVQKTQENATVQKLEEALNQRHCLRKGFGPHLLQRVIDLR